MKTRLLLVEDDIELSKKIIEYFKNSSDITILAWAQNGNEAIKYISTEIDIILLDYVMPEKDGFGLIKYLKDNNIKIKTILMTGYRVTDMLNIIEFNKISYIIFKPFNLYDIKDVILRINNNYNNNISIKITEVLTNLGMPANMDGFDFTRESIIFIYNNYDYRYRINYIYAVVAKECKTTKTKVERDMRYAIFISWARADVELLYKIFGNTVDKNKSGPTNSEYIYTIVDKLKMGMI